MEKIEDLSYNNDNSETKLQIKEVKMRKKKKYTKILAFFLAAVMTAASFPVSAWGTVLEESPPLEEELLNPEEVLLQEEDEPEGELLEDPSADTGETNGGIQPLSDEELPEENVLQVDGVDAFTVNSGEGWSYDADAGILYLDGYDGGRIVTRCDLIVELAAGSYNKITVDSGTGLGNGISFGENYTLDIRGAEGGERPTLEVNGTSHAIQAVGSMSLKNLNIIASNEAEDGMDGSCGTIFSEYNLTVENCSLDLTSNGAALTCFDALTVTNSNVVIDADVVGIHANNRNLTISDTYLEVSAKASAALQSRFGGVYLTNCTGTLTADQVAVSTQNLDKKYITQMTGCELTITAPYGVLSYGDVKVSGGELEFKGNLIGIWAYTADAGQYTGDIYLSDEAWVISDTVKYICQASGSFNWEPTSFIRGVVFTEKTLYMHRYFRTQYDYVLNAGQNLEVVPGADVVISGGKTLDTSAGGTFVNNGILTNLGTVRYNGAGTENYFLIDNQGDMIAADQKPLTNNYEIYSICTKLFAVTGNEIEVQHDWNQGEVTKPPTIYEDGVKTFTCQYDNSHTYTEPIAKLVKANYDDVEAAIEEAQKLDPEDYEDFSAVTQAIEAVQWELDESRQNEVDAMAAAIQNALDALVELPDLAEVSGPGMDSQVFKSLEKALKAIEEQEEKGTYTLTLLADQEWNVQGEAALPAKGLVLDGSGRSLKAGEGLQTIAAAESLTLKNVKLEMGGTDLVIRAEASKKKITIEDSVTGTLKGLRDETNPQRSFYVDFVIY